MVSGHFLILTGRLSNSEIQDGLVLKKWVRLVTKRPQKLPVHFQTQPVVAAELAHDIIEFEVKTALSTRLRPVLEVEGRDEFS